MEQPSHGKQMIEFFEVFHVFYDLMEEYMEKLGSGNGLLYLYCKDQFLYYNFFPLSLSSLFLSSMKRKLVYGIICLSGFIGSQKLLDWKLLFSK